MIIANKLNHIIYYGQSLSFGSTSTPISVSQPYDNVGFTSGPRESDLPLVPLVEVGTESPVSGTCNYLHELTGADFFGSTGGTGGQSAALLQKGLSNYNNRLAPQLANAAGTDQHASAICYIQGERDTVLTTDAATYTSEVLAIRDDIIADVHTHNGAEQSSDPVFVIYQTPLNVSTYPYIALAQLDMAAMEGNTYSTPLYPFESSDGTHMTADSYLRLGAYNAKAIHDYENSVQGYIKPVSAIYNSNLKTVVLTFDVPHAPLVLDTSIGAVVDSGFVVNDTAGTLTIDEVVPSGNQVTLKLASTPANPPTVRYALDSNTATPEFDNGAAGNLRDSDSRVYSAAGFTFDLFNWTPHFEITSTENNDMAALVPVTDTQVVFLHDLDDQSFTQDGDLVHVKQTIATVNANGTVTITNPDGTTATSGAPVTDTNTIQTGATYDNTTGVLTQTFEDVDGAALPDVTTDLSAIKANTDYVFTNGTDGTFTAQKVDADGNNVGVPQTLGIPNTDVTANLLEWNTTRLSIQSTVTEGGVSLLSEIDPDAGDRVCGDRILVIDPDTRELTIKGIRPEPLTRLAAFTELVPILEGTALTPMVGQVVADQTLTVAAFAENTGCYAEILTTDYSLGNIQFNMVTPGDRWVLDIQRVAGNTATILMTGNTLIHQNNGTGVDRHGFGATAGSTTARIGVGVDGTIQFQTTFNPTTYTEHAVNAIDFNNFSIRMTRQQVTIR